ncbi:GxxExxY protein [Algoriphagus taiwanensis]
MAFNPCISEGTSLNLAMHENEITFLIRGAIFKVYNTLGPELLESSYEAALGYELVKSGLLVEHQVGLPLIYQELKLEIGYRIDLLVEKKVIVEIKSVEQLLNVHHLQIMTYLRLSNLKIGLLVNFNTDDLTKNIVRKINGFL